jgi:hypothetical protein
MLYLGQRGRAASGTHCRTTHVLAKGDGIMGSDSEFGCGMG